MACGEFPTACFAGTARGRRRESGPAHVGGPANIRPHLPPDSPVMTTKPLSVNGAGRNTLVFNSFAESIEHVGSRTRNAQRQKCVAGMDFDPAATRPTPLSTPFDAQGRRIMSTGNPPNVETRGR